MSNISDFPAQEGTGSLKIPKKRGRPAGVLNRPKGDNAVLTERVEKMYDTIEHMLPPEQREYYKRAFSGKEKFDPMKHAEFFTVLYGIYANDILLEAIENQVVSQDIAQTLREYRMSLKELDDMHARRQKEQDAKNEQSQLVDTTRKPAKSRVDEIIERATTDAERRSRRSSRV